jgi:hypothetical protein
MDMFGGAYIISSFGIGKELFEYCFELGVMFGCCSWSLECTGLLVSL